MILTRSQIDLLFRPFIQEGLLNKSTTSAHMIASATLSGNCYLVFQEKHKSILLDAGVKKLLYVASR